MAQILAKKLEQTVSTKKERVASAPQCEQLARTPEPPLPKEKETEPSVQIMRLERFKVSERSQFGEREASQSGREK